MRCLSRALTALVCLLAIALVNRPLESQALPVPGAVVWFDAEDLDGDGITGNNPLNGTNISSWVDKAGSVQGIQTATQGTVGNQPTYAVAARNGNAALNFTANNKFLVTPAVSMGAFSYFTVSQSTGASLILAERGANINVGGVNGEFLVMTTGDTFRVKRPGGDSGKNNVANWGNNNTWMTGAWLFNGTNASQQLIVNGSPLPLSGGSDAGLTVVAEPFFIGARTGGAAGFTGNISEVVAFDASLNSARTNVMQNYLAARYDLPLPAPIDFYDGDTLAAGDYDLDVIGIGEEIDGNNDTSSGAGLTLTESAGSLDSGDYLMAGHRSLTTGTTTTPFGERSDRVWFVDKTGTLDADLTFDLGELDLTFDPALDIVSLLYAPTSALGFSVASNNFSIIGDEVTFTLADGDLLSGYYTLAVQQIPEPASAAMLALGFAAMTCGIRRRTRRVQAEG